mgnify:CR=1 FL=1
MKKPLRKILYPIYNRSLKLIIKYRFSVIFLLLIILIIIFQFGPSSIKNLQDNLGNIVVELMGALIILFFLDFLIYRIILKSSYPKTKEYIYGNLKSALQNISLDIIHNFLKIHDKNLKEIQLGIIPFKDYHAKGIEIFELYTKEENREIVEDKYIELTEEQLFIWYNTIAEQREKLSLFISNATIIRPKDIDLSEIIKIDYRLLQIEKELKKSKNIRIENKKFLSSYVFFICKSIINTMKTGLYEYWCIPEHIGSVMKRSED